MNEKTNVYRQKLLALVREIGEDREYISYDDRYLFNILRVILFASWYYKLEDVNQLLTAWNTTISHSMIEDAIMLLGEELVKKMAEHD